jgi:hypothetical protein
VSASRTWTARVTSGLVVLFLLFSATMKFLPVPEVEQTFQQLGLPLSLRTGLGLLELGCTVVYAVPRTRLLGAVLLTGYLGGAIVTHLRVGSPLLSHTLFPVWLGALLWVDVLLRDDRLRARMFASPA